MGLPQKLLIPALPYLCRPHRPRVSSAGGAASSAWWEEGGRVRLLLYRGAGGAKGIDGQLLLLQQKI